MLPITVISAGAGSGKTYTLTERMVDMLRAGVRPGGILATTFTQKAAAELQERVRVKLLEEGMTEAANELGSALIGTVHSIGVKLLQRFAFELGVSPLVEVIAEGDGQRLFNESLAQVLTADRIDRMTELADRLGLTKKTMGDPYDFRRDIRSITDVARANNFSKETLQISKLRSWEALRQYLPEAEKTDPVQWHNRLISSLEQTVAALEANTDIDTTKTTGEAIAVLRGFENQLKWRGELYWHEWVKIGKTNTGAKSKDLLEALKDLVRSHDANQRFHDDVRGYIELVFDIATDALHEFEQYKMKRGLIDYTDMETYVSRLLRIPGVQDTLRTEIDLLLVDEFQDTSPIQLDIFLQLSRLARHSIWVGDPKQSIYGFRGAEPALMQAIIAATGGVKDENILKTSWRSRADLVEATNAIFTRAFRDLPPAQIELTPANLLPGDKGGIIHWHFVSEVDARKVPGNPWLDNCIANQIVVLLERQIPVWNKNRTGTRPVRPGDIAVLCRNNSGCLSMADALHRAGLKASIARTGLLETPEIRLILAYLKRLVNANDQLSAWEITLLSGQDSLENLLTQPPVLTAPPFAGGGLGVGESLAQLIATLDLRRTVIQMGNAAQRLDNLERLRRYALDYESACDRIHSAATVGGFLIWLNQLADNEQDMQGSGESEDAVKVLTYHKSKGMEYPVAICHSLDQKLKEQIWGISLISESAPDLDNILGGRWLRFWVNPYADQLKGTRLMDALEHSPVAVAANRIALDEEARLLYVGITRARDYWIVPSSGKGTGWLNRVFNQGDEAIPTLDPDSDETPFYRKNGAVIHCLTEQIFCPKDFPEADYNEPPITFHAPNYGRSEHQAYQINPATEVPPGGFTYRIDEPQAFAPWLIFKDEYNPKLSDAVRSVLLGDHFTQSYDTRIALITKQLAIQQVSELVTPAALLQHSDAFGQWLTKTFQPTTLLRYMPCVRTLPTRRGDRLLNLHAHLLLRTHDDLPVVVQFMPFAEGMKKWKSIAQTVAPTLGWWRWALQDQRVQLWLVFGVEGQVVTVQ